MGWVFDPMLHAIGGYAEGMREVPNLPAGDKDFKGCKK